MTTKSLGAALITAFLLTTALLTGVAARTASAADSPSTTACPAAYELVSVTFLEGIAPYKLPRLVDTAGNNDGYVCGLAMPDTVRDNDCKTGGTVACILEQLGLPLYRFKDNHIAKGS